MPIFDVLFGFSGRINRTDYWLKGVLPLVNVVQFFCLGLAESQEGRSLYGDKRTSKRIQARQTCEIDLTR